MRTLSIFLSVVLIALLLLLPVGSQEAGVVSEGLAVPVQFTTRIRGIIPVPLLVGAVMLVRGSVEGEMAGLPARGDFSVYMVQVDLPLLIFSIPIARRTELKPITLTTPAGTVVVYGAVSGRNLDRIFVEADPGKGTGAFQGVAARGTLNAVRIFRGGGEFSGQIVFSWISKDVALQALGAALEGNAGLEEGARADYLNRVRRALDSAAIAQFPPSPVAMNPPKEQKGAPDRPQVDWDVKAEGGRFEGSVRVVVPKGPTEQELRVVIVGSNGASEIYSKLHAPGQRIEVPVSGVLPAVIQVYLDHLLIGQIKPEVSGG